MQKTLAQLLDEQCANRIELAEAHVGELADMLIRHAREVAALRSLRRKPNRSAAGGFTAPEMQKNLEHQAGCHGKEIAEMVERQRKQRLELEKLHHLQLPQEIREDKSTHE